MSEINPFAGRVGPVPTVSESRLAYNEKDERKQKIEYEPPKNTQRPTILTNSTGGLDVIA